MPTDQAIIERFNGTLKQRLNKIFTKNGNHKWVAALPRITKAYNNEFSRAIGMSPNEFKKQ